MRGDWGRQQRNLSFATTPQSPSFFRLLYFFYTPLSEHLALVV